MTRLLPITSALIASLFAAGALGLIANLPAEAAALSTPMMGYAWADQPTNPSYTPNLFYQRNTSGLQNTIARPALGVYNVRFPRLGVAGGTVDVSTYGFSTDNCQVGFWFRAGSDEVVNVRCFTVTGVPADSRFTVAFIAVPGADALDYVFANQPSNPSYTPTPIFQYNHNGSPNAVALEWYLDHGKEIPKGIYASSKSPLDFRSRLHLALMASSLKDAIEEAVRLRTSSAIFQAEQRVEVLGLQLRHTEWRESILIGSKARSS